MRRRIAPAPHWTRLELGLMGAISALALALRLYRFDQAPALTDNADELDWAWSGMTLIRRGVPYGWSYLRAYGAPQILRDHHTSYPIVHPYLDHPPLFSLFTGAWALLLGARQMTQVTLGMIRPPVIVLSVLALILVYVLGRRVLGRSPAMLAILLLATSPGAVLLQREVESESLLAVLVLAALICVLRLEAGEGGWPTLLALVGVCLAGSLTKVPGISIAGVAAVLLLQSRRWWPALAAAGAGVAGLGVFALYGAVLDWRLFLAVWTEQAARRSGVFAAFQFIAAPAGVNRPLHDGWWLLGWLGLAGIAFASGRGGTRLTERYVVWPAVAYAVTMLLMADQRVVGQYGWYRIAVYPLVYLGAGSLVWRLFRAPSGALLGLLLALGGAAASSGWLGSGGEPWTPPPELLFGLLVAALLPTLLIPTWPRLRSLAQACVAFTVLVLVLGNVVEALRLPELLAHSL